MFLKSEIMNNPNYLKNYFNKNAFSHIRQNTYSFLEHIYSKKLIVLYWKIFLHYKNKNPSLLHTRLDFFL